MNEHRFSDLRIGMEAEFDRIAVRGGRSHYYHR